MDPEFWHHKWQENDIAFHEGKPNPLLQAHFQQLGIPYGGRVFLPLCGKTRDIAWLLAQGYQVTGAELSELAISQLFSELGLVPEVRQRGKLTRYSAHHLDILVGDFFDIDRDDLGPVQAVYDRAALVALPAETRQRYTAHLVEIVDAAPQLLIAFDYDQAQMDGPPFSVDKAEVHRHYGALYRLHEVARQAVPGGLKGKAEALESAWLLERVD
ncbi:thiopurine S-methyltransferase [Parahaliea aestuarii]|uniref:Thiopurine S-methyltransferase n=1 Tax=Parahaliea aestuarii TaxID=1852021 RepID=A0A5C8ZZR4_9GAMM|nr:thiopurine S-methyltransferase [Parahaliea aestuarii]TXS93224.1 thiopurine S-methyltransferase [Parahaliea aestuarii]